MLLDYDRFDFIKTLLANRSRVFYCTRLKQAQTEAEAEAVRAQMAADVDGGGAAILEALAQTGSAETWAQDRAADFANRTRREAVGLSSSAASSSTTASARAWRAPTTTRRRPARRRRRRRPRRGGGARAPARVLDLDAPRSRAARTR